jgi:glycerophosphoryl diester phosphodiesterase
MRAYGRRLFLRHSLTLAAAATAGRALPGSLAGGAVFSQGLQRPLEILVLGDSVMWGQGLEEGQKFYNLTRAWLERVLPGRRVNVPKVKAHSGATILDKGEDGECYGEVNYSSPTINEQLDKAVAEYTGASVDLNSIDLVLVNGGINDLGAFTIVQPLFPAPRIRAGAQQYCYVGMKALLGRVVRTFPNATVVVTGYFPLITMQTPPDMLLELILLAFGDNEYVNRFGREAFELARRGLRLRAEQSGPALRHAAAASDLWYRESNSALRRAVEEVNLEAAGVVRRADCEQAAPATVAADVAARRVVFARPKFCPENGYGVKNTSYFWQLVDADRPFNPLDSPIERLKSNDNFFEERAKWCECKEADKKALKYQICQRAGTGHPNVEGAREYERAIIKALTPVLPFTGWLGGQRPASPAAAVAGAAATAAPAAVRRGLDHPFFAGAVNRPEVIAHRGGAGQWPEETLFAFEQAVKLGVDVLEFDVRSTSDCELVLMHDRSVARTTDGVGNVENMTLAELKELDAGYQWTKDGRTYPFRCQGMEVATLREVFGTFRATRMIVEIKQSSPPLVARLCRMIREFEMTNKVLVASFDEVALRDFRWQCPEVATSTDRDELINFLLRSIIRPGSPAPEVDAVQPPADVLLRPLLGRRLLDRARELRLPVHAWRVDSESRMRRMIRLGVDGIITDEPGLLMKVREQERAH